MKYKKFAIPQPSLGEDYTNVPVIVVPDQSLSLKDILERFTRDESLPIGQETNYGENEDDDNPLHVDLEKLAVADLTEKAEYRETLAAVTKNYERQEKQKAFKKAQADKISAENAEAERIEAEVKKRTNEKLGQ